MDTSTRAEFVPRKGHCHTCGYRTKRKACTYCEREKVGLLNLTPDYDQLLEVLTAMFQYMDSEAA